MAMNNEQAILDRLDQIEARLTPLCNTGSSLLELKEDILPLLGGTMQALTKELGQVESGFELKDLQRLAIKLLRSVRNMTIVLEHLDSVIDFVNTVEPLLKSSVPQLIGYLDDLEQKGVLRIIQAGLGLRSKIAASYSAEDIEQIGDGLVVLLGLAKQMGTPEARCFLNNMAAIPGELDLSEAKPVGALGLLSAMKKDEIRAGLGVLMELTKAMCKLKPEA